MSWRCAACGAVIEGEYSRAAADRHYVDGFPRPCRERPAPFDPVMAGDIEGACLVDGSEYGDYL